MDINPAIRFHKSWAQLLTTDVISRYHKRMRLRGRLFVDLEEDGTLSFGNGYGSNGLVVFPDGTFSMNIYWKYMNDEYGIVKSTWRAGGRRRATLADNHRLFNVPYKLMGGINMMLRLYPHTHGWMFLPVDPDYAEAFEYQWKLAEKYINRQEDTDTRQTKTREPKLLTPDGTLVGAEATQALAPHVTLKHPARPREAIHG